MSRDMSQAFSPFPSASTADDALATSTGPASRCISGWSKCTMSILSLIPPFNLVTRKRKHDDDDETTNAPSVKRFRPTQRLSDRFGHESLQLSDSVSLFKLLDYSPSPPLEEVMAEPVMVNKLPPIPLSPPSSQPHNLPRSAIGNPTRIEVEYRSFYEHVLAPADCHRAGQIHKTAEIVTSSSKWKAALEAYTMAVCQSVRDTYGGRRKNRFTDLLNCIVEEGPLSDPAMQYTHDITYMRCTNAGATKPPRNCSYENSKFPNEPWRDYVKEPCVGVLPEIPAAASEAPVTSIWHRAALVVDVYNNTLYSPPESFAGITDIGDTWADNEANEDLDRPMPPPRTENLKAQKLRRKRVALDKGKQQWSSDYWDSDHGSTGYDAVRLQSPRLSVVALEEDYWAEKKIDDGLRSFASQITRAVGNRRHVLGIYAKGFRIRFYLYDRAGTIYSTALDLTNSKDLVEFISAILSLSCLDSVGLGLEPMLAANSLIPSPELLQRRAKSYINVQGISFYLQSILHTDSVVGRGTTVYAAIPATPDEHGVPVPASYPMIPSEVVIKLSWPDPNPANSCEEKLLKLAAYRGVQGVPRLYASETVCRLSDTVRGRLVPKHLYVNRELRIQVMGPRAIPLYEVSDPETFKKAFRSLLTIHHDLFTKARILHRDISPGNLMVDASNPSQGILIDFDFAALVNENGDPLDNEVFMHAGTLSFRAHDLISSVRPVKAYYRHDLESFFLVLLWIQIKYPDGKPAIPPPPPRAPSRESGSEESEDEWPPESVKSIKNPAELKFYRNWKDTRFGREAWLQYTELREMPPGSSELRDKWVGPLLQMFREALKSIPWREDKRPESWDEATYGGAITYEAFMCILAD